MAVSRDTTELYLTNRLAGTISVIDFATRRWSPPGRGREPGHGAGLHRWFTVWVSNRYGTTVEAISTPDGRVIKRIEVGRDPHGLACSPSQGGSAWATMASIHELVGRSQGLRAHARLLRMDAASCCLRGVDDDERAGEAPTASPSSLAAGHHPSSAPLVLIVMENHEKQPRARFAFGAVSELAASSWAELHQRLRRRPPFAPELPGDRERDDGRKGFRQHLGGGTSPGTAHRLGSRMTAARHPCGGRTKRRCPPHATRPPRPVLSPPLSTS